MQDLTPSELKQKIQSNENFILDLYATWCGPCKVMLNNLSKLTEGTLSESLTDKKYNIYKFDIDKDKEYVVTELGIRSVPTIKFYKEGKEYFSKSGVMMPQEVVGVILND